MVKFEKDYVTILNNCKFSASSIKSEFDKNFQNISDTYFDSFTLFNSPAFDASKFDVEYYKKNYLNDEDCDPINHYLSIGVKKGFNPNAFFDTNFYLNEHLDVKNSGENPFIHYMRIGIYEGRIPKILSWVEFREGMKSLKTSLKGRRNYLFLINDSNNEILQHFDENYENLFDSKVFLEDYYFKKELLIKDNIDYHFFIVPDKSIVCKELLPFKYDIVKRNVDNIDEIIDFKDILNFQHYFKNDSHMNYDGGNLLSFKFLNYLNKNFSLKDYNKLLDAGEYQSIYHTNDLTELFNWSYSSLERILLDRGLNCVFNIPKNLKNLKNKIPQEFLTVHTRESEYYENEESFSDLRVLIFHDSSFNYLKWYFSFYFKEMFLYWDHGNFNKSLIEWFKPDLILEVRIERFLENIPRPDWIKNKEKLIFKE